MQAAEWSARAAEQGFAEAQYELGECYYYGNGIDENETEAVKWYQKAAEQGDTDAQFALGKCYFYGNGIEENY